MVWDNITDNEAAMKVGFSVVYLRTELKKPHVRAYYRGQLEVLRSRESSRNIHTLIDVRDQTSNQMARVQAVKALEQIDDSETGSRANAALPGLQIVIVQGAIDTRLTHAQPAVIDNIEISK